MNPDEAAKMRSLTWFNAVCTRNVLGFFCGAAQLFRGRKCVFSQFSHDFHKKRAIKLEKYSIYLLLRPLSKLSCYPQDLLAQKCNYH